LEIEPISNLRSQFCKLFNFRSYLITQLPNQDIDVWRLFGALLPLEEEADQDEAEAGNG
jgi:hypothetical protein